MGRAVLLLLGSVSLMGCLITIDPTYSPPRNTPAVILPNSPPMNRFINVNRSAATTGPDGGVGAQLEFSVFVRDPDIDQDLEALAFINHNPDSLVNTPITNELAVPPSMTGTRSFSFFVDAASLPRGCQVLELHVAGEFENVLNPIPVVPPNSGADDPVDLGRGIWYLRVFDNPEDEIPLRGCEL